MIQFQKFIISLKKLIKKFKNQRKFKKSKKIKKSKKFKKIKEKHYFWKIRNFSDHNFISIRFES